LGVQRLKEALAEIKAVHRELLDLLLTASADEHTWERWRNRLWTAVEKDGVDYLSEVVERWVELCRMPERASRAADDWVSVMPSQCSRKARSRSALSERTPIPRP
jgi:hypothetical protein